MFTNTRKAMYPDQTVHPFIITRMKKKIKMNKEIGMMLPKKELIQVE